MGIWFFLSTEADDDDDDDDDDDVDIDGGKMKKKLFAFSIKLTLVSYITRIPNFFAILQNVQKLFIT